MRQEIPVHPGESPTLAMTMPAAMGRPRVDPVALAQALREEAKLLGRLRDVLLQQREAVAADDLSAVDRSVFDAQRVLLSLNQARRRRRTLIVLASGDENLKLSQLPEVLGRQMTPELQDALEGVLAVAGEVSKEMELNRHILHGALMTGNEILLALGRAPGGPRAAVYGDGGAQDVPAGTGNVLLNRQV